MERQEGQQRFDSHVDKPLSYIRYWQASGESIKTSLRVKTRMEQLTQEGHYTGGCVPMGYFLKDQGRVNKKNQAVGDLYIEPSEAETVKLIFQKYVHEGYGAQRLCQYLAELGVKNRKGRNIPPTSINHIIKNPMYTGVIYNGDSQSKKISELQIIDRATFSRAQEIMEKRVAHHADVPLHSKSRALLVGNVYCGHCGGPLTLTTSGRKCMKKDGTVRREVRARYACHYNIRHPGECGGQSGYGVTKLNALVSKIVRIQFEKIKAVCAQDLIVGQQAKQIELAKAKLKLANDQYQERKREYDDLRAEAIKVIRGTSRLNSDLLNDLVKEATQAMQMAETGLRAAQAELDENTTRAAAVRREYARLINWAELYEGSTFEAKKMIVAQFVKAVYVRPTMSWKLSLMCPLRTFKLCAPTRRERITRRLERQCSSLRSDCRSGDQSLI